MDFDRVRPARVSDAARAEISEALRVGRLEREAARLWTEAIDRGDFAEASRIAAETQEWFTDKSK